MRSAFIVSLVTAFVLLFDPIARAEVPVRIIQFDDIKPRGATLDGTFEAVGLDPQERVYATLCNGSESDGDCYLFRWDPKTGGRKYLGSLVQSAKRVGNIGPNRYWSKKEVIVKGHTHNVYLDGQMWMGTMNLHGYNNPLEHRGIHIFGYKLSTGVLTDHSQWQPKGVFKEHSGMMRWTPIARRTCSSASVRSIARSSCTTLAPAGPKKFPVCPRRTARSSPAVMRP